MPSVNDVFEEIQGINDRLNTLHGDNGTIIGHQVEIRNSVDAGVNAIQEVRAAVDSAVAVLNQLANGQQIGNAILLHLTRQADTMICSLEQIARNTCALHTEAHHQTHFQEQMASALADLLDIAEATHPAAAVDLQRRRALQSSIEHCCPPPSEPPACIFEPCARPDRLDLRPDDGPVPVP